MIVNKVIFIQYILMDWVLRYELLALHLEDKKGDLQIPERRTGRWDRGRERLYLQVRG